MLSTAIAFFLIAAACIAITSGQYRPKLNPHIVGGRDASVAEYPYIVSLRILKDQHFCGGSIYSPKIVITAAHCLTEFLKCFMTVHAGSSELNGESSYRYISSMYKHPGYKHLKGNDIGIVTVTEEWTFNQFIKPIPLSRTRTPDNAEVIVLGWGYLAHKKTENSNILQIATLNIVDNKSCAKAYKAIKKVSIDDQEICALGDGTDACQNDSGGPLVYEDHLLGVVSFGYGCASPKHPGVYVSIPDYYDWILEVADNVTKYGTKDKCLFRL